MTERDQMAVYILASKDISKELGLNFIVLNFKDADRLVNLLKEEAVKPDIYTNRILCGNCGARLDIQKVFYPGAAECELCDYCPHCGKKVDWEAVRQDDQT